MTTTKASHTKKTQGQHLSPLLDNITRQRPPSTATSNKWVSFAARGAPKIMANISMYDASGSCLAAQELTRNFQEQIILAAGR